MRKETQEKLDLYIQELQTIRKLRVSGKFFLETERYHCVLGNGKEIHREKLIKNNKPGHAAIILPITKDNKIIITIQPRVFTERTVGIGLPAGYVEEGEDYEEAARRELEEETGYRCRKLIEMCAFSQDEGISGAFNKGFLALGCERVGEQELDKDEYIRILEVNPDELIELIEKGYILDGGSQLLIERSKEYIKKGE